MTKTFIGIDSTGVPCVKITKGTINPYSEPDANRASFYFNSKWEAQVSTLIVDHNQHVSESVYYPSQANWTKAAHANYTVQYKKTHFPSLSYSAPLFEVKLKNKTTQKWETTLYERDGSVGGASDWRLWDYRKNIWNPGAVAPLSLSTNANYEKTLILWNLPADDEPLLDTVPAAPVSGQRVIEISKDYCRVAKPGYDVRTARPTQLAFDSSMRPLQVIAAGNIDLPAGQTVTYALPQGASGDAVADFYPYIEGSPIRYPLAPQENVVRISSWCSGGKLYVQNFGDTLRARFIVLSVDGDPPTSGAYRVFDPYEGGIRFIRPGAAENLSHNDIILDSARPTLRILAEGYFNFSGFVYPSDHLRPLYATTINFDATGFLPIVKYMQIQQNFKSKEKYYTPPNMQLSRGIYQSKYVYWYSGYSSYCELSADSVTFYATVNGTEGGHVAGGQDHADYPIVGIRYYILGIPTD